jgi:hypothetical protein
MAVEQSAVVSTDPAGCSPKCEYGPAQSLKRRVKTVSPGFDATEIEPW